MKKLLCLLLLMLSWIPLLAHAEDFSFTVTDVTVKNDDGTSRQEILAELLSTYGAYTEIPVRFQTESRPGVTDIFILADGAIIGKFSSKDTLDVISCITAKNTAAVKIGVSGDLYFAYVKFHDTSPASATKSSSTSQLSIQETILIFSPLLFLIIAIVFSILWCKRHPGPHPALRRAWLVLLWAALNSVIVTSIRYFGNIVLGALPTILIAAVCLLLCRKLDHWLDARATKKAAQAAAHPASTETDSTSSKLEFSISELFKSLLMLLLWLATFLGPIVPLVVIDVPWWCHALYLLLYWLGLSKFINPITFAYAFICEIQRPAYDALSIIFFVCFAIYWIYIFILIKEGGRLP